MAEPVLQETFTPQYGGHYVFYRCPQCRELFCTEQISIYGDRSIMEERYPHAWMLKFCPSCGQEITWAGRRA